MTGDVRPTRLSLRDMRADALWKLLLSPRGRVASLDDIYNTLPDLASWGRTMLEVAIGDLVADGRLVDDEYGRPYAVPPQDDAA